MKIDKLPSGSYNIRKTVNHKTYSITFDHKPTKKEIEQAIAERITDKIGTKGKGKTFKEYALEYIEINTNTLKPSTRRAYTTYTRTLSNEFLSMRLADITQADVQLEINRYSATHAPKGVINAHGFISRILTFYRPDMALKTNLPAKVRYEKYVPTPEEVDAVLEYCNGTMAWGCYRLFMYGLRKGELIALTLDDLSEDNRIVINKAYSKDQNNNYILMNSPKTDASFREITIDKELADFFRKQGYIYKGSPDYLYSYLSRIQTYLGQPHWRLHDFRAYMCTELSQVGFSEADILRLGGWSSSYTMKEIYRRSRIEKDREAQQKAADVLSRKLQ